MIGYVVIALTISIGAGYVCYALGYAKGSQDGFHKARRLFRGKAPDIPAEMKRSYRRDGVRK